MNKSPYNDLAKEFSYEHGLRPHWPIVLVAAIGLVLIFTNLGRDYLAEDEGDTAVLASNILKFSVPKAWDGVAFLDSDQGARLNSHLVMVTHPWVPYYLTAASFLVFGQNSFAARLPFALAAWMSILLVYLFAWRISASRLIAVSAASLLLFSVQFLLYARQCRYYSLNILLGCWLYWIFFQVKSVWGRVLFALVSIVSFHTHPYGLVPAFALGGLSLIYRPFKPQRRWLWFAAPAIAVFTLPWLALSPRGYAANTDPLHSVGELLERIVQSFIECASVTPLVGNVMLFLIFIVQVKLRKREIADQATLHFVAMPSNTAADVPKVTPLLFQSNELSLLLSIFVTLLCYVLSIAATQSSDSSWLGGIRYASPLLPLLAIAAAILIIRFSRGRIVIWFPLLLIFGLTKLAQLTPCTAWNPSGIVKFGQYSVAAHVPSKVIDRFLGAGLSIYVRDLWRENPGVVAKTCKFLRDNAKPGDVVIVNSAMESVYFYTRLPQAMAILDSSPIYPTARRLALPEYLFEIDHVHWIVWRPAWEGWTGYSINDLAQKIRDRGGRIAGAMEMEDTVFENREDIHFHRFSDGTYLFPFPKPEGLPAARIGRVDWPNE